MVSDSCLTVTLRTRPISPSITALIFVASGELDMLDAPDFWKEIDQVITRHITPMAPAHDHRYPVVFNLAGLQFVDSNLAHLIRTTQRRLEHEYNLPITDKLPADMLCVCEASGFARRAIQLMRLERMVAVFATEAAALAHFR